MNRLFERLSRWPRKRSHGPAGEIWSVVHFPFAFSRTGIFSRSVPSHARNGSRKCSRSLSGFITTSRPELSAGGGTNPSFPFSKPLEGSSSPEGGSSFTSSPLSFTKVSLNGLNESRPLIARAVIISGDPMKARVEALPSFRRAKLRLNEVTMVFFSPSFLSSRFHCPIHGPQAFASTIPPMLVKSLSCPSRSIVARTCSEPGVTRKGVWAFSPLAVACLATWADRSMSS